MCNIGNFEYISSFCASVEWARFLCFSDAYTFVAVMLDLHGCVICCTNGLLKDCKCISVPIELLSRTVIVVA